MGVVVFNWIIVSYSRILPTGLRPTKCLKPSVAVRVLWEKLWLSSENVNLNSKVGKSVQEDVAGLVRCRWQIPAHHVGRIHCFSALEFKGLGF